MSGMMSIVVATGNRSKVAAIKALLEELPVEVLPMAEALGQALPNIVEDGGTFEDNALKKARIIAQASSMVTVAEDAGLEVVALGGRPGVRSHRFAGEGSTDAENNAELLRRMEEIEDGAREAHFRMAIALVDPWAPAVEQVFHGCCEGRIARSPSGAGGFGYDALFVVSGDERTLAELPEGERRELSHRGKALRALQPALQTIVRKHLSNASSILRGSYVPPSSKRSP